MISATIAEAALTTRIEAAETAAIIKLGRHLPKLKRVLERLGRSPHAICIARASLPMQRIESLSEIDKAPYFSLVMVGRSGPGCALQALPVGQTPHSARW